MQDDASSGQEASKLKSDAKQQHYVPQFLLRNFAPPSDPDRTFTYTFNKNDGRSYPSAIRKTASQFRYNEIEIHEGTILETALAGMEGEASSVIKEIIKRERVDTLSDDQRYQIALFIAVQIGRTPTFRDEVRQFRQALGTHIGQENWSRYSF